MAIERGILCPACGYELGFESWRGRSASQRFCPCCSIHFGYHDVPEGGLAGHARGHLRLPAQTVGFQRDEVGQQNGRTAPRRDPIRQLRRVGLDLEQELAGRADDPAYRDLLRWGWMREDVDTPRRARGVDVSGGWRDRARRAVAPAGWVQRARGGRARPGGLGLPKGSEQSGSEELGPQLRMEPWVVGRGNIILMAWGAMRFDLVKALRKRSGNGRSVPSGEGTRTSCGSAS